MERSAWKVDPAHSGITFSVRHMLVAKVRGRFGSWSADLRVDEADLTRSSIDVSIDAATIETGVADRDGHLRSADFLDAEKHPNLTFRSKRIEKADDARFRIVGDLQIRGVTHEVVLDAEYGGRAKDPWGNERIGVSAHATIDRTAWGLRWNQALEAGGLLVGEKVEVEIELQAIKVAG